MRSSSRLRESPRWGSAPRRVRPFPCPYKPAAFSQCERAAEEEVAETGKLCRPVVTALRWAGGEGPGGRRIRYGPSFLRRRTVLGASYDLVGNAEVPCSKTGVRFVLGLYLSRRRVGWDSSRTTQRPKRRRRGGGS